MKEKLEKLVLEEKISDQLAQLVIDNLKRLDTLANEVDEFAVEAPKRWGFCPCLQFVCKAHKTEGVDAKLKAKFEEVQRVIYFHAVQRICDSANHT